jgi:arsenite methyltransferase
MHEGKEIINTGSGTGIDVFLAKVKDTGRVIDIDMTEEMLEKAITNAKEYGYTMMESRLRRRP